MSVPDIKLLSTCAHFTVSSLDEIEATALKELKTKSETSLVMSLRSFNVHRIIFVLGMFSYFESWLQNSMQWKAPFLQLPAYLTEHDKRELSVQLQDYLNAVDVLKYGRGAGYDALLARRDKLEFKIKKRDENFFEEGDVSEVETLIRIHDQFIARSAELIERAVTILEFAKGDHVHTNSDSLQSSIQDWTQFVGGFAGAPRA